MGLDVFLRQFGPRGRTLVVGSKQYMDKPDRRRLYKNAIGLDLEAGEGVDVIHDLEEPLPDTFGLFEHIDCVSVIEHVKRPWLLCANIEAVMAPGATILVSVPFIWRVHAYPSDYWRLTIEALPILFPNVNWIKRGYLCGDELVKKPGSMTVDGQVYMQKTESVAFGVRNTDNARHIHEGHGISHSVA